MISMPSRSLAQSARSVCDMPHGFPEFSMPRYALPSSVGKFDSIIERYRRMSRILSRISMLTGQISSHALHVVHAQTSSAEIRWNTSFVDTVSSGSWPTTDDTAPAGRDSLITWPILVTISRGSSGLPVAWAGHTDVHRPQIVQASVSRSCFQVKSSMTAAPKLSSSDSIRFGIGFIAPLGRSRSDRYMFSGDVTMWRSFVVGTITMKAKKHSTWTTHTIWCSPLRFDIPSNTPDRP